MNTPWGKADNITRIERGLSWVDTPSHGGFAVSESFAKKHLSTAAQTRGEQYGSYLFFEEDCLYAIVAWEIGGFDIPSNTPTQEWRGMTRQSLLDNLSAWNADYLLERGQAPSPTPYQHYLDRQEDLRLRAAKGPVVICAWGDWKEGVPKGHVKVALADGRAFILTSADYAQSIAVMTIDKYPTAVLVEEKA